MDQSIASLGDAGSLLRSLIASSGDCIKILDLDGNLLFMTEGGQRIMEVSDFSSIKGCPWPSFWQGRENADALAAVASARAGRTAQFQGFATTVAGTPKWWDVHVSPIFGSDGKPERLLSVSRDITAARLEAQAIAESEARFKTFAQVMPNQVWSATPDGLLDWFNDKVFEYSGLGHAALEGTGWARMVHPDDIGGASQAWAKALSDGGQYQMQFRLKRADGVWRWHLARAMPIKDHAGLVTRWIGTNTDIEEQKAAQAQQTLLTEELDHRIKNMLAMVAAVASQTFRTAATKEEARAIFDARLGALNNAHQILTRTSWSGASLALIVEGALASYRSGEGRIKIAGPEVQLPAQMALPLALALHELATNATKYGALSVPTGTIDIAWDCSSIDGAQHIHFEWRERGGPPVSKPSHRGFGSRLIERTLASDSGNSAAMNFDPAGLVCTFNMKLDPADRERTTIGNARP